MEYTTMCLSVTCSANLLFLHSPLLLHPLGGILPLGPLKVMANIGCSLVTQDSVDHMFQSSQHSEFTVYRTGSLTDIATGPEVGEF